MGVIGVKLYLATQGLIRLLRCHICYYVYCICYALLYVLYRPYVPRNVEKCKNVPCLCHWIDCV